MAVARVAPPGYRVAAGDPVVTVGCNNGDDPTATHCRILAVDKFRGPHNLQVEGEPVEGRSGGGVFSSDGMVVGICNAADRDDHAAYCAALPTIYPVMDRANVAFLYKEEPKGTWSPAARKRRRPHRPLRCLPSRRGPRRPSSPPGKRTRRPNWPRANRPSGTRSNNAARRGPRSSSSTAATGKARAK